MARPKTKPPVVKPAAKSGKTKAEVRRAQFVEAYLTNGQNATKAAIALGFARASANHRGYEMLHHPDVERMLGERARKVAAVAEMTTENWAREVSAIAFARPGSLLDEDGTPIPMQLLPDHVQAAIASVKTLKDGTEVRFHDKTAALTMMGKHLGLFEKDNAQKTPNIKIELELVG